MKCSERRAYIAEQTNTPAHLVEFLMRHRGRHPDAVDRHDLRQFAQEAEAIEASQPGWLAEALDHEL